MWTYSGNPASSPRDAVRYRIGDTDPDGPLLTDESLDFELQEAGGSVRAAAAEACRAIAAKFARDIDKSDEGTALKLSQRRVGYLDLAAKLDAAPAPPAAPTAGAPLPFAGGLESEPRFELGMHDHP